MISKRPSKLLVKQVGASKFLKATGQWSRKIETAFSFPSLLNAIHLCLVKGLEQVELIIRFDGESADRCYVLDLA